MILLEDAMASNGGQLICLSCVSNFGPSPDAHMLLERCRVYVSKRDYSRIDTRREGCKVQEESTIDLPDLNRKSLDRHSGKDPLWTPA